MTRSAGQERRREAEGSTRRISAAEGRPAGSGSSIRWIRWASVHGWYGPAGRRGPAPDPPVDTSPA